MDPISNMIIAIKNAGHAGNELAKIPYSRLKEEVAHALERGGYIVGSAKKGKRMRRFLEIKLKYRMPEGEHGGSRPQPYIADVARISRQSRRVYQGAADIRTRRFGAGVMVLSTPKGILIDREAKKQGVGGELLFAIYGAERQ